MGTAGKLLLGFVCSDFHINAAAFREKVTLSRAETCILQIAWQDLFLESSSGAAPLHPGGLAWEPLIMLQQ